VHGQSIAMPTARFIPLIGALSLLLFVPSTLSGAELLGNLLFELLETAEDAAKLAAKEGAAESAVEHAAGFTIEHLSVDAAAKRVFASVSSPVKHRFYVAKRAEDVVILTSEGKDVAPRRLKDAASAAQYAGFEAARHPLELSELLIEQNVFLDGGFPMQNLPSNVTVRVVWKNGSVSETRLVNVRGTIERFVVVDDSLLLDMRDKEARSLLASMGTLSLRKHDIQIVTLIDPKANRGTVDAIQNVAKKNGVRNSLVETTDIESVFRAARGKLLLVVGHTEGSDFVVRLADNSVSYTVSFAHLASLADASNATLILLGCRTGPGGLLTDMESLDLVAQLDRALATKDYSHFYAALGTHNSPFVLTAEQIDGTTRLVEHRLEQERAIEGTVIESATTISRRPTEIPTSTGQWIRSIGMVGAGILIILLIGAALSVRSFSVKPFQSACWLIVSPIVIIYSLIKVPRRGLSLLAVLLRACFGYFG
jgi:hypothetical protein